MEKGQPDPEICDERDTGMRIPLKIGGTMINLCLCHRDPERSIKISGRILPICARCRHFSWLVLCDDADIHWKQNTPLYMHPASDPTGR